MAQNARMPQQNIVIIQGRAGRDVELRYTAGGTAVGDFSLAVTERFKPRGGGAHEWEEKTAWFQVTVWAELAERLSERGIKGMAVLVEGKLTRSEDWTDNDGKKNTGRTHITARNVQETEWKDDGDDKPEHGQGRRNEQDNRPDDRPAPVKIDEPVPEDDIPF